jgi:hypothetical protein
MDSHLIEKVEYDGGNVWINETQYFKRVPGTAWQFIVGAYQPAVK